MAGTEWPFTLPGRQFFDGTLPSLVREIKRLADELKRYNDKAQQAETEAEQPVNADVYVKVARKVTADADLLIAIDDNAKVSTGFDDGAYVQAWVWVAQADIDEEDK